MNFAYLCDASYDNDEHLIESYMSIFNIHSINTKPFNMGTNENSHILHISKDVTLEERRELEKNIKKILKSICLDVRLHAWHRQGHCSALHSNQRGTQASEIEIAKAETIIGIVGERGYKEADQG